MALNAHATSSVEDQANHLASMVASNGSEPDIHMDNSAKKLPKHEQPPLVSVMDLASQAPDPRLTLLGERWLCVGAGMIFGGPSGIGKSSAGMQQDLLWSLGRDAFGIRPARPLRILTVQAENDEDDLAEAREGVCKAHRLGPRERALIGKNVFYEREQERTGGEFIAHLDRRLSLGKFDIVRIDPLQAFLGASVTDDVAVKLFLRHTLDPILRKHRVACIICHHTPKTNGRDTSMWRHNDWSYAIAGSAEITNWARAVMVIDPTHAYGAFNFIAGKRGERIGWFNQSGERERTRLFCHGKDGIYWESGTPDDHKAVAVAAAEKRSGKKTKTPADLLALVAMEGSIAKNTLIVTAQEAGIGRDKMRLLLRNLISEGKLFEWKSKRPRTNDEVHISRHPQTETSEG